MPTVRGSSGAVRTIAASPVLWLVLAVLKITVPTVVVAATTAPLPVEKATLVAAV